MRKGAFVAGNHLCWFSRNEKYKQMTVNDVLKENPKYINWCLANLKYLRFATGLTKRIKKVRQQYPDHPENKGFINKQNTK